MNRSNGPFTNTKHHFSSEPATHKHAVPYYERVLILLTLLTSLLITQCQLAKFIGCCPPVRFRFAPSTKIGNCCSFVTSEIREVSGANDTAAAQSSPEHILQQIAGETDVINSSPLSTLRALRDTDITLPLTYLQIDLPREVMLPPRDWPKYGELAPSERAPGVARRPPGDGVAGEYCRCCCPWLQHTTGERRLSRRVTMVKLALLHFLRKANSSESLIGLKSSSMRVIQNGKAPLSCTFCFQQTNTHDSCRANRFPRNIWHELE